VKYSFSNRVVNEWNNPSSKSLAGFKNAVATFTPSRKNSWSAIFMQTI